MVVAVLSLQGAVIEHIQMLDKLGVGTFEIRKKADLDKHFDGLIIPGGESTVQGKLLHELDIYDTLKEKIEKGLPVFGTCAGLLLLAKSIDNDNKTHLATMDITAMRNAYGRQLGSFYTNGSFDDKGEIPMTFIREPYISSVGDNVKVLATVDGKIVGAREGNQLVTAFHPELNDDLTVHKYFVDIIKDNM